MRLVGSGRTMRLVGSEKTMRRVLVGAMCLLPLGAVGCDLGPYPNLLDALDRLESTESDGTAWISVTGRGTGLLMLSEDRYLSSMVQTDTSVVSETGEFEITGDQAILRPSARYTVFAESGPVSQREGAQSEPVEDETREVSFTMTESELTVGGMGTFVPVTHFLSGLDLETEDGRGCLLRFLQVTLKTARARVRNLGSGGTAIYRDNETAFEGFIDGEITIVLADLLNPKTTITYDQQQDMPQLVFNGQTVANSSTSGQGTQTGEISFTFTSTSEGEGPTMAGGGAGGAPAAASFNASGTMTFEAIELSQSDPVGGNYRLTLELPTEASSTFPASFLQTLDLTSCQ